MTDFNYKEYSLENLENWLNDAISSDDVTPQEIYDTIVKVVRENYEYHKQQSDQSNELLSLLNGHRTLDIDLSGLNFTSCSSDDFSTDCKIAWNDFWENDTEYTIREAEYYNSVSPSATQRDMDKVNRWVLPVQVDGLTGECSINLPDDLLERAGLKEGDMVHWIDRKDGSFELRKVNVAE